ncbi:hypothetical protein HDU97_007313 [Phlyctochytrium planicorne]|nr:hypothetical protein HDU97_007313 [Phlyctochytrium planicorne]
MPIIALSAAVSIGMLAFSATAKPLASAFPSDTTLSGPLDRRGNPITVSYFEKLPSEISNAVRIDGSNVINGNWGASNPSPNLMRLNLNKGGGGVSAVAPRGLKVGEAACSQIYFPGTDYHGVSMTFYSIGSDSNSSNNGKEDEIDFEYLGDPLRMQFNYFVLGKGGHEFYVYPKTTTVDLCMANTGTSIKETAGIWNCCGTAVSPNFIMDVKQFSVFTLNGVVTTTKSASTSTTKTAVASSTTTKTTTVVASSTTAVASTTTKPVGTSTTSTVTSTPTTPSTFPPANNCVNNIQCDNTFARVGIINNSPNTVSIRLVRGSTTFNACSSMPKWYGEMCVPAFQAGDLFIANNGGKDVVLDWTKVTPGGNYYQFTVSA